MREYTVTRGGVELTMLLSDEDAKRLRPKPVVVAVEPVEDETVKEREPANKARKPTTK